VEATLAATAAVQRAHPEVRVEQFGGGSANKAITDAFAEDFERAETLSLPITLVILVVAFGALVAAGLPLLLGLTAVAGTIGLLGPVSQLFPLEEQVSSVVLLVGLAVGVDYSMFYLRREMEERDAGRSPQAALEAAAATSGRAVLISGFTVMIAMAGMFFAGNATFVSFAVGTILVVAVAVVGSLTFLPAMLAWLGRKGWTEKGRVPYLGKLRHRNHGESRVWAAILDRVLRRPLVSALAAFLVLAALAVPALGMKTINTGLQGLPRDLAIMQTYDRLQAAFPGAPVPAMVVVRADDVGTPAVQAGIDALRREAIATGTMSEPVSTTVNPAGNLAVVNIPMQGTGTDDASTRRSSPARHRGPADHRAGPRGPGRRERHHGQSEDFTASMRSHLPLVFAFVLGLAFLLLLVTFRSVVIPIKAIALNLLSVGASYGVLKLVFQDGHGEGLLGFTSLGGIAAWLPLFLFVILFGLSMDYHVFILSRIREAIDRGMPNDEAGGARHQVDRRGGDERGRRDGLRVRHLRHAERDRLQDDGRRPGRRRPPRRDHRPGGAAAGHDEAPGRLELVPARLAGVAAALRARAARRSAEEEAPRRSAGCCPREVPRPGLGRVLQRPRPRRPAGRGRQPDPVGRRGAGRQPRPPQPAGPRGARRPRGPHDPGPAQPRRADGAAGPAGGGSTLCTCRSTTWTTGAVAGAVGPRARRDAAVLRAVPGAQGRALRGGGGGRGAARAGRRGGPLRRRPGPDGTREPAPARARRSGARGDRGGPRAQRRAPPGAVRGARGAGPGAGARRAGAAGGHDAAGAVLDLLASVEPAARLRAAGLPARDVLAVRAVLRARRPARLRGVRRRSWLVPLALLAAPPSRRPGRALLAAGRGRRARRGRCRRLLLPRPDRPGGGLPRAAARPLPREHGGPARGARVARAAPSAAPDPGGRRAAGAPAGGRGGGRALGRARGR
jgi:hypothetical protein